MQVHCICIQCTHVYKWQFVFNTMSDQKQRTKFMLLQHPPDSGSAQARQAGELQLQPPPRALFLATHPCMFPGRHALCPLQYKASIFRCVWLWPEKVPSALPGNRTGAVPLLCQAGRPLNISEPSVTDCSAKTNVTAQLRHICEPAASTAETSLHIALGAHLLPWRCNAGCSGHST